MKCCRLTSAVAPNHERRLKKNKCAHLIPYLVIIKPVDCASLNLPLVHTSFNERNNQLCGISTCASLSAKANF